MASDYHSALSKMNGLPFMFVSVCDMGTPGRRQVLSKHTSRETAERSVWRIQKTWIDAEKYEFWLEDMEGNRLELRARQAAGRARGPR